MSARLPELALPALIREADAHDRAGVARMLAAMDRDGLYQRHFAHGEGPKLALLDRLEHAAARCQVVIVAEAADGRIVGHGEYVPEGDRVEFALMVLPAWRGRGIARDILLRLAARAGAAGYREMYGLIQADNTAMLCLARQAGLANMGEAEPYVLRASLRLEGRII